MRAGTLRHEFRHQTKVATHGEPSQWEDHCTFHGSLKQLAADEAEQGTLKQVAATVTYEIMARGSVGPISPQDRLLFGGRVLHVVSVEDVDARGIELRITARGQK